MASLASLPTTSLNTRRQQPTQRNLPFILPEITGERSTLPGWVKFGIHYRSTVLWDRALSNFICLSKLPPFAEPFTMPSYVKIGVQTNSAAYRRGYRGELPKKHCTMMVQQTGRGNSARGPPCNKVLKLMHDKHNPTVIMWRCSSDKPRHHQDYTYFCDDDDDDNNEHVYVNRWVYYTALDPTYNATATRRQLYKCCTICPDEVAVRGQDEFVHWDV
jgi:hypothetical protein